MGATVRTMNSSLRPLPDSVDDGTDETLVYHGDVYTSGAVSSLMHPPKFTHDAIKYRAIRHVPLSHNGVADEAL